MVGAAPVTRRCWLGTSAWLLVALALSALLVYLVAPTIDPRAPIAVLAFPLVVGIARSGTGVGLSHADRTHRGLVAAAWTASILACALVGGFLLMLVLFALLSRGL